MLFSKASSQLPTQRAESPVANLAKTNRDARSQDRRLCFAAAAKTRVEASTARSDLGHIPRVFDLQTIECVVPIAYFTNAQKIICIVNDLRERRHD